MLCLRTRQGLTSLRILPLHSPHCSLPRVLFHPDGVSSFLPVANKLTAPKLDAIAAVQAATIIFLLTLLHSPSC